MISYSNTTLSELGGASATVFLPSGVRAAAEEFPLPNYYESSRFEWGSMIGSIRPRGGIGLSPSSEQHVLYGTDLWRVPHDPHWTESGVGLASEFGFGDDGAACVPGYIDGENVECGWVRETPAGTDKIVNGVLGYEEAAEGEPFLKIGVGKLRKGSCESCDPEDLGPGGYKFNSPYRFFEAPSWHVTESTSSSIALEHEAVLYPSDKKSSADIKRYGYRIQKRFSTVGGSKADVASIFVETSLTNLGTEKFATPWYSHHFFTCDGSPVGTNGKGYGADLDVMPSSDGQLYSESGVGIWSTPLEQYATTTGDSSTESINIVLDHEIEEGIKIKAEFPNDGATKGSFVLHGCGTTISESVLRESMGGSVDMFAFNLYAERGTLSPEPLLLISAKPGETVQWTQQLTFHENSIADGKRARFESAYKGQSSHAALAGLIIISLGVGVFVSLIWLNKISFGQLRQNGYSPIE